MYKNMQCSHYYNRVKHLRFVQKEHHPVSVGTDGMMGDSHFHNQPKEANNCAHNGDYECVISVLVLDAWF